MTSVQTYPVKRMSATEVIEKQERYRTITILEVGRLLGEGFEFDEIAKEAGIGTMEVRAIISEYFKSKSKRGRPIYRKFF